MEQHVAYLGLGSNLGERENLIKNALGMLHQVGGIKVTKTSEPVETSPLANMAQPRYINAVAEIITALSPQELLAKLAEVETLLGRTEHEKWASRRIDIDLLLFDERIIQSDRLIVPHPQMHLRSFVLRPLSELKPDLVHPVLNERVCELAGRLNGCDFAFDASAAQIVSIAGNIGAGKTTLAKELGKALGCKILFEPYDTNPFMPAVYEGKKELALDSQLYFLTGRLEQLDKENAEPGRLIVADYVFEKERIYASQLLAKEQLKVYDKLYRYVAPTVAGAVLVIFLDEPVSMCRRRIRERGRPYEQDINAGFLEALAGGYERLFSGWNKCPVIRLSGFDAGGKGKLDHLVNQIEHYTACLTACCEQPGGGGGLS